MNYHNRRKLMGYPDINEELIDGVMLILDEINSKRKNKLYPMGYEELNLKGKLNHIFGLKDKESNEQFILRVPKPIEVKRSFFDSNHDFHYMNFLCGRDWRFRTIPEIKELVKTCNEHNIPVNQVVTTGKDYILEPYVQGTNFADYLVSDNKVNPKEKENLIMSHIDMMVEANKKGITFGDRWSTNTIVSPDKELILIDFDLIIMTDPLDFDLVEVVHGALARYKDLDFAERVTKKVYNLTCSDSDMYNLKNIAYYIEKHIEAYPNLSGKSPALKAFIELSQSLYEIKIN